MTTIHCYLYFIWKMQPGPPFSFECSLVIPIFFMPALGAPWQYQIHPSISGLFLHVTLRTMMQVCFSENLAHLCPRIAAKMCQMERKCQILLIPEKDNSIQLTPLQRRLWVT